MYLQAIALVCLSIIQSLSCYEEANTGGDVILEYLRIDPKTVSKHQVTTIDVGKMHKRDVQQGTAIKFQAIDEEISLWLRPRDSMLASDETPVYQAHYAPGYPGGVYFEQIVDAMKGVRQLLEDPEHYATVVLGTDDAGKTTVNGYLRSPRNDARLVISSLPEHIVKEFFVNQSSINDLIDDTANMTYHVVIELNDEDDLLQKIAMKRLGGVKAKMPSSNHTDAPNANTADNQSPDTLYPQILIHLDYTFNDKWADVGLTVLLEYTLAFWNGVDLVYRQMVNPKIRLNIAGIVVSSGIEVTPYFWNNIIENDTIYDRESVTYELGRFYYSIEKASPLVDFDAVFVMTRMYGSYRWDLDSIFYGNSLTGFLSDRKISLHADFPSIKWPDVVFIPTATRSGQGSICYRDNVLEDNRAVAVITDNGAHSGIFIAAHAMGHLLGASDEDDSNHVNCTKMREGSVMESDSSFLTNRIKLTDCALEDIRENFKHGALDCLYNVPRMTGTRLPGLMPGKTLNIVEQCGALGYGPPCLLNEAYVDACVVLWCAPNDNATLCTYTGFAAAAGTQCLKDTFTEYGVCLKSNCVSV